MAIIKTRGGKGNEKTYYDWKFDLCCNGIDFLVFWGKLPSDVPIHFDSNGNVNSVLPKTAVVFGTPAICAILNVLSGLL